MKKTLFLLYLIHLDRSEKQIVSDRVSEKKEDAIMTCRIPSTTNHLVAFPMCVFGSN